MKKHYITFTLMLILVLSISNAVQQRLTFVETFGTTNFTNTNNCQRYGEPASITATTNRTYQTLANGNNVSDLLDNQWYCSGDRAAGTTARSDGDSARIRTNVSMLQYATGSLNGNENTDLVHFFDTPRSLIPNSEFNLSCFKGQSGLVGQYIIFGHEESNESSLAVGLSNNACTVANQPRGCVDVSSVINSQCDNETYAQNISFTFQDVLNINTTIEKEKYTSLDYIGLSIVGGSGFAILWDDITIGLYNGTNQLPIFNVTTDRSQCSNTGSYNISLDISAYDFENDTIYYALEDTTEINETYHVEVSNTYILPLYTYTVLNDEFYSNLYIKDNCDVTDTGFSTNHTILTGLNHEGNIEGLLYLSQDCPRTDKRLIYDNVNANLGISFSTYFYGVNTNESFNITYYDSLFNEVFSYRIENNGTDINYYAKNDTGLQFIVSETAKSTIYITLANLDDIGYLYTDNGSIILVNSFNYTKLTDSVIDYISIGIDDDSSIYMDKFDYSVTNPIPTFTTTKPNNITLEGTGTRSIRLYVSDSEHIPNEYTSKRIDYFLQPNNYCLDYLLFQNDSLESTYVNINNLEGIPLYINQLIWMIQFPYRLLKNYGLDVIARGAVLLAIVVAIILSYTNTLNIEASLIYGFIASSIMNIMKLMYEDMFVFLAFFFSLYFAKNLSSDSSEGEDNIKYFIYVYGVFALIVIITNINTNIGVGFFDLQFPTSFSPSAIWTSFKSLVIFIFSLLSFSITAVQDNYISQILILVINGILWIFRVIIGVEIINYVRKTLSVIPFIG